MATFITYLIYCNTPVHSDPEAHFFLCDWGRGEHFVPGPDLALGEPDYRFTLTLRKWEFQIPRVRMNNLEWSHLLPTKYNALNLQRTYSVFHFRF